LSAERQLACLLSVVLEIKDLSVAPQVGLEPTTLRLTGERLMVVAVGNSVATYQPPAVTATLRVCAQTGPISADDP
jgi:hypothetical protein